MNNNIYDLELDLLTAIIPLVEEQSVSRAAKQLGISQPAMSLILKRLRNYLSDPILVRSGRQMIPTPKALALMQSLKSAVKSVQKAIANENNFDPLSDSYSFSIVSNDFADLLCLPEFYRRLDPYPNITLQTDLQTVSEGVRLLKGGQRDYLISFQDNVSPEFRKTELFVEQPVLVLRKGHPALNRPLTLKTYLNLSHIAVKEDWGAKEFIDEALKCYQLERKVNLHMDRFISALFVVSETDYALATSQRLATLFQDTLSLEIIELPFKVSNYTLNIFWHARIENNLAHQWFINGLQKT